MDLPSFWADRRQVFQKESRTSPVIPCQIEKMQLFISWLPKDFRFKAGFEHNREENNAWWFLLCHLLWTNNDPNRTLNGAECGFQVKMIGKWIVILTSDGWEIVRFLTLPAHSGGICYEIECIAWSKIDTISQSGRRNFFNRSRSRSCSRSLFFGGSIPASLYNIYGPIYS
jgi:hypothetical protein